MNIQTTASDEEFYKKFGFTSAFLERHDAIHQMLDDMANAETRISMYARVYLSELIKQADAFSEAIINAVSKSSESHFLVEHISTNYSLESNERIIRQLWLHENADHRRWATVDDYVKHLQSSDAYFVDIQNALVNNSPSDIGEKHVEFRRAYIKECFLPYSMLIIDKKIMYVSFYTLTKQRYGTHTPTLRLSCEQNNTWGASFLDEISRLEKNYVDYEFFNKASLLR